MSTLGVIIPTKNSLAYLPRHLGQMSAWLDLATEVVVVDSHSRDGTFEYFQQHLHHPKLRLLTHPPGLYESWNFGVQTLTTDFAYLATVGDTITRAGLQQLITIAEKHGTDVVMSKPTFRRADTGAAEHITWPVDDILAHHAGAGACRLRPLEMLVYAAGHSGVGLLGSTASNLYRTTTLQRFPFPLEFGKAGDGAWAVMHAADVSWSVTPEVFTEFLLHPTSASPTERQRLADAQSLDRLLADRVVIGVRQGQLVETQLQALHFPELLAAASAWMECKQTYDQARQAWLPWSLTLSGWQARMRRNRARRELDRLKEQSLRLLLT